MLPPVANPIPARIPSPMQFLHFREAVVRLLDQFRAGEMSWNAVRKEIRKQHKGRVGEPSPLDRPVQSPCDASFPRIPPPIREAVVRLLDQFKAGEMSWNAVRKEIRKQHKGRVGGPHHWTDQFNPLVMLLSPVSPRQSGRRWEAVVRLLDQFKVGEMSWNAVRKEIRKQHKGRVGGPHQREAGENPKLEENFYLNPLESYFHPPYPTYQRGGGAATRPVQGGRDELERGAQGDKEAAQGARGGAAPARGRGEPKAGGELLREPDAGVHVRGGEAGWRAGRGSVGGIQRRRHTPNEAGGEFLREHHAGAHVRVERQPGKAVKACRMEGGQRKCREVPQEEEAYI
ncbi:unnamed protein product [Closterium sp. Naga37s-1]|nr:unnamed protein product [Closterium sp. Naga37s-1]